MRKLNLSALAVRHSALTLFLLLAIAIGGGLAYFQLGRAEDPSFTIKVAVVTAIWPGATAAECRTRWPTGSRRRSRSCPISTGCRPIRSPASWPSGRVSRHHAAGAGAGALVSAAQEACRPPPELPAGLIGPNVDDEYGDVDAVLYALTGDGADFAQLKQAAEALRQRLLSVPDAVKVNLYGVQDEKILSSSAMPSWRRSASRPGDLRQPGAAERHGSGRPDR